MGHKKSKRNPRFIKRVMFTEEAFREIQSDTTSFVTFLKWVCDKQKVCNGHFDEILNYYYMEVEKFDQSEIQLSYDSPTADEYEAAAIDHKNKKLGEARVVIIDILSKGYVTFDDWVLKVIASDVARAVIEQCTFLYNPYRRKPK